ncbi:MULTISPECIES: RAD55 family ATPase [unclassified Haladaptatus]|uniref:RAD55 family ATPase n=1 Tax=unclassified Haladaptatus TaxID=2622732 RepID=UPI0023E7E165|nr:MULTISPECIES: RAD55 family ATPase [unclassified Haladaptatus]
MVDDSTGQEGPDVVRCDFCRHPIPEEPVLASDEAVDYQFCSLACRDALETSEFVFTEYHGFMWFDPGVSALEQSLPQGAPRNAFVLLSGPAGTRDRALQAELVWRTLRRGESAVIVTFQEPPGSLVQQFLTFDWNVLPYLERDQLHILDCFTYRLSTRERMYERLNEWNQHLYRVAQGATTTIRDPTDIDEVTNKLDNCLENHHIVDSGMVLIDSLTEFGALVQPVRAYDFVRTIRADVCKGRFVPVYAGATVVTEESLFPHDLEYVVDGVIDLRLTESLVPDTLLKQIRIRKMKGVLVIPEWHTYEYTSGLGMVTFDPEEEQRKSERREEETEQSAESAGSNDDTAAELPDDGTEM